MEEPIRYAGKERRLGRSSLDALEIEIHEQKVRVWVDGATVFFSAEENQKILIEVIIKAMDKWVEINRKQALERLGRYALGAMLLSLLAALGWKGWGGK